MVVGHKRVRRGALAKYTGSIKAYSPQWRFSCEKVIEEINELIDAVENNSNKIHEAADVFYHLIMYLEANDVKIEDVMEELNKRKK